MARGRKCRSSQADLDAAVEAVVTGASYKAAEEMTGVPRSTVRDYVVRRGLVRGSVPRPGRKNSGSALLKPVFLPNRLIRRRRRQARRGGRAALLGVG
jgi:hypothetical protein